MLFHRDRGIGMWVTHGCIRMFPEDVESLFNRLAVGTDIRIVNQPAKAGWIADRLFVEAHPVLPAEAENAYDPMNPRQCAPQLRRSPPQSIEGWLASIIDGFSVSSIGRPACLKPCLVMSPGARLRTQ